MVHASHERASLEEVHKLKAATAEKIQAHSEELERSRQAARDGLR
jgi:hypothetical protein